jgi:hypothetical protein
MPNPIVLFAAATLAAASLTVAPRTAAAQNVPPAAAQPAWQAIHADTVADLLFTTEAANGRVRFVARGLKGSVPVTTSDFPADSVKMWAASATELVANATPKMGDMRGLGQALTLNVTTATTGETAYGFYVGDAATDQQLALALTKANAVKLTSGVNTALAAVH